ncbi:MAG: precorrin-2 C(20)-methyltransferase [Ruminococcus sp.]|nr:precorrin-2 C(20)-methyltransferase [Ruminococcus sp.]
MGKLYGVSVGAGDPELITLKAVKIVEKCAVLAVPRTDGGKSLALEIVRKILDLSDKKIIYFDFPMVRDRLILEKNYNRISEIICGKLSGNDVAFLNLGDISIYSTFGYIAERVRKKGFEVEICAGVTSFCAVSATVGRPLVSDGKMLHIIPYNAEKLRKTDFSEGTYIIMKCGKHLIELVEILNEKGLADKAYAVENCGLENERIFRNIGEISDCGYFTVVIVEV